jgi:hypothetical protein
MRVEYHPAIEGELREIKRYYEDRSPGLGIQFIDEFERQVMVWMPPLVLHHRNPDLFWAHPSEINYVREVQNEFGLLKGITVQVSPSLQLAFPSLLPGTGFALTLAAPDRQTYQLETSTNLVDWESVAGLRYWGWPIRITNVLRLPEPMRFFRAVIPE